MQDSVFTKIVKGELPSHKIYEDDRVIVIMDISPITTGHCLAIPKQQVPHLWDLDDDTYNYLLQITRKVALRLREVVNPPKVGMVVDGYGVPEHAHINIMPLYEGLEHTVETHLKAPRTEPDHDALAKLAAKLAF